MWRDAELDGSHARKVSRLLALTAAHAAAGTAQAEMSAEELAKLAQNPVGNLISLPFQNNTNFNVGPYSGARRTC
jgi:hypothetical protein